MKEVLTLPQQFSKLKAIFNASLIGIIIGFLVSIFRFLIEHSLHLVQQAFCFAHHSPIILIAIVAVSVIVAIVIGLLLKSTPAISGSGIPQIEGALMGDYQEHWWPVLWKKFVGGVLAIGSGLMLGREGPSIQLGAMVGQGFAETRQFNAVNTRTMIASGAAAGLSAAFNAPIASTMFVIEEIYHNFSPSIWLSSLASAIIANFVSLNFFGLRPSLEISYLRSLPLNAYVWLIPLGILLGLLGRLYQISLLAAGPLYKRLSPLPTWLNGMIPLLLLIPIGFYLPAVLGGGNHLIINLSVQKNALLITIGIFILRFIFSNLSYGSGLPGGIFLPILTLGAFIGAIYLICLTKLGLIAAIYLPNFIIYAMAGYFAGIGKAPFTAILLITEMVGSLGHLMPLAVVALLSYVTVDTLHGAPIYASLLERLVFPQTDTLQGKQDFLDFPIYADSTLVGKQVKDVDWPNFSLLVSIHRGEQTLIPNGNTIIHAGDTLTITHPKGASKTIRKQLEKE